MTGDGVGDVIEELPHAALVHDLAEDDEQHDIGGRHLDGRAVDAVDVRGEVGHDPVPGVAPVLEDAREGPAVDGVDQEDDGQDGQRPAAEPLRGHQHQHDQDGAQDDVDLLTREAGGDERRIADEDVDGHGDGQGNEDPVIPGDLLAAGLLAGRIEGEAQDEDQAHVDGVVLDVDHLQGPDAGGVGQMVQGEQEADDVYDVLQPLRFKGAGPGFLLELLHDLRAFGGVQRRRVLRTLVRRGRYRFVLNVGHLIDTPLL